MNEKYGLTVQQNADPVPYLLAYFLFMTVMKRPPKANQEDQNLLNHLMENFLHSNPVVMPYLVALAMYCGKVIPVELLADIELPTKKQFRRFLGPYASDTSFTVVTQEKFEAAATYLWNNICSLIEK